jgi:hypothetical protein
MKEQQMDRLLINPRNNQTELGGSMMLGGERFGEEV